MLLNASFERQSKAVNQQYPYTKVFKTELKLFQRYLSEAKHCPMNFTALQDVTLGSSECRDKKNM